MNAPLRTTGRIALAIAGAAPMTAIAYWPSEVGPLRTMPEEGPSSIVANIFDFFIIVSTITAIGMLVYAGILYIISRGNIGEQKKARDFAVYSIIGLVVVFFSYAIVTTVTRLPLFSATGTLDRQIPIDPGAAKPPTASPGT